MAGAAALSAYLLRLQDRLSLALEAEDGGTLFAEDARTRAEGGVDLGSWLGRG